MNLFLDTNAVVKLYHNEIGTKELNDFLTTYSKDLVIIISDITKIEFHSTFLKRVRAKEIDSEILKKVFLAFENDSRMFNVIDTESKIKSFAVELLDMYADRKNLRTLDSIQLSTAILLSEILKIDYFVTSDKKLIEVAKVYFKILNPETMLLESLE